MTNIYVALLSLALAAPAIAQGPIVATRLNGMELNIEELGVPRASSDKVDLVGVPAIKVTNHGNEVASCQFHSLPDETVMTATPSQSIDPNEQVVMRVPGRYSNGGPIALLVCQPEGANSR